MKFRFSAPDSTAIGSIKMKFNHGIKSKTFKVENRNWHSKAKLKFKAKGARVERILGNNRQGDDWGEVFNLSFYDEGEQLIGDLFEQDYKNLWHSRIGTGDRIVGFYTGTMPGQTDKVSFIGFITKEPLIYRHGK